MTGKERYQQYKKNGICPQCKKRKAEKGKIKCGICMYDDKVYKQAKREIKKLEAQNEN
jgi:hypothetical protein